MGVRFSQSGLFVISKKRLPDQSSRTFFKFIKDGTTQRSLSVDCAALLKYSVLFGFADRWAEYSTVNAGHILHISFRYCGTCQLEFNRSNAIEDC